MEGSKTILVPIDFQGGSQRALAMAREMAPKLGYDITLLHVFTIPVTVYPGFDPIVAPGLPGEIASAARNALEQIAAEQGPATTIIRAGNAADEILKVIEERQPALVIMGTHGRSGLSHLFLGSVTEKVIRASKAPILSIRTPVE